MGGRLRRWEVPIISRIIDRSGVVEKNRVLERKSGIVARRCC
jgi:hypothetical protein